MTLKNRIISLAQKATAANEIHIGDSFDWEARDKVQKEVRDEMLAIDKAAGGGMAVGRLLKFRVADGMANYIITKIRKNDVVVEWIPIHVDYWSQAVGLSADKKHYVVNRYTAEQQCQYNSNLKSIFSNMNIPT